MQQLFHQIFSGVQVEPFAVQYPNGDLVQYGPQTGQPPAFTWEFKSKKAMRAVLTSSDLGFGEAYLFGDIVIHGSLMAFMETAMKPGGLEEAVLKMTYSPRTLLRHLPSVLKALPLHVLQTNTYEQSKEYIAHHYDAGNEFFKLMLDKDMVYTCAYFKTPQDTLDQAQEQKREHVCRKLMLKPGDTLLDIGCGWGGMLIYAAQHYGITGLGITLSKAQAEEANTRIIRAGLEKKIRVEYRDYRDLPADAPRYDKISAIGIMEHIGVKHYHVFLTTVKRLLKPNGIFLLHHISNKLSRNRPPIFARKYLFPGAYTPSLAEAAEAISRAGLRVTDVENLRLHYSLTAQHWLNNFEKHKDAIRKMQGDIFVKIYELYLNHGVAYCRYGAAELLQFVITPDVNNDLPLTREHLYLKK